MEPREPAPEKLRRASWKGGRPRLTPAERRSVALPKVRLTPAELAEVRDRAGELGLPLSEFIQTQCRVA